MGRLRAFVLVGALASAFSIPVSAPSHAAASAQVHGAIGFLVNYERAKGGPSGIYRMNVDGSGLRQILPNGSVTGGITADGQRQYYWIALANDTVIASADANGHGVRRLSAPKDEDYNPNISADGRVLGFGQGFSPDDHLAIADANGRHVRAVPHASEGTAPSFFPDAKRLAYMRGEDNPLCCAMYTIGVDGRGKRSIANGAAGGWPVVSPDGRMIAFLLVRGRPGTPQFHNEIAVQAAAGGPVRRLTAAGTCVTLPQWSPDGQVLFFGQCARQGNTVKFGSDTVAEIAPDGTGLQVLARHLNSSAGLIPIPGPRVAPTATPGPSASASPAHSAAPAASSPAASSKNDDGSSRTGPLIAAIALVTIVAAGSGVAFLRWR